MEKVELVRELREEHELSMLLSLLDLPRSTWYYHTRHRCTYEEKYRHLRKPLEQIALEHPKPFEVLYTDFTELCYASGKGYLITIPEVKSV